jgi:hypothetical protein
MATSIHGAAPLAAGGGGRGRGDADELVLLPVGALTLLAAIRHDLAATTPAHRKEDTSRLSRRCIKGSGIGGFVD